MTARRRSADAAEAPARSVTTQAPHLAQPNDISTLSRDRAIRAACRSAEQGPLRGCDRGGTHKHAHIRHDASRSGVASKHTTLGTCSALSGRPASVPPYVGRLHGVLTVLPSTRIASVAHAGLMQSFPKAAIDGRSIGDTIG